MNWIAWKMLTHNRGKYLALISGTAFAALLIAQQISIFCGVMLTMTGGIQDVHDADVWVMDPGVEYIRPSKSLRDLDVERVRGVPGVAWAAPHFRTLGLAQLPDGRSEQVFILGFDSALSAGAPQDFVLGSVENLRRPNGILIDTAGFQILWPGERFQTGKTVLLNHRRFTVEGVCRASKNYQSFPIIYMSFSHLSTLVAPGTELTMYILTRSDGGSSAAEVCRRITAQTGLQALTSREFEEKTWSYVVRNTGIAVNFAVTVFLGFLVGLAVSGQTFYLFTVENLAEFAVLKALGATNGRIVGMILFHALVVGCVGFGIGIGLATWFGDMMQGYTRLACYMPWQVFILTGASVVLIVVLASLVSIRKVLVLDPSMVFSNSRAI